MNLDSKPRLASQSRSEKMLENSDRKEQVRKQGINQYLFGRAAELEKKKKL